MNEFFIKLIVCFAAGMGAGIGTGLSGLSAAAIISPMLKHIIMVHDYLDAPNQGTIFRGTSLGTSAEPMLAKVSSLVTNKAFSCRTSS